MHTAPHNYRKMVARIKLCKRSFKITCSSFSAPKVDLRSICHVPPGSSGISVGTEGSVNPKSSLYGKTLKEKRTNIRSQGHTPCLGPGPHWAVKPSAVRRFLRSPSLTWQEGPSLKSSRSSFQSELFHIQNFQNGDAFTQGKLFITEGN